MLVFFAHAGHDHTKDKTTVFQGDYMPYIIIAGFAVFVLLLLTAYALYLRKPRRTKK